MKARRRTWCCTPTIARELTEQARAAIARIVDAGVPMLAQTVLLKGVNDDAETLEALMRALVEARVKPYYLHHLDKAPGTSHFRCTIARRTRAGAGAARARVGLGAADLCARHSRRSRQSAAGAAERARDRRWLRSARPRRRLAQVRRLGRAAERFLGGFAQRHEQAPPRISSAAAANGAPEPS